MSVLTKMGIKMKTDDGEALKKSVEEVGQLLRDLGVPTDDSKNGDSGGSSDTSKKAGG